MSQEVVEILDIHGIRNWTVLQLPVNFNHDEVSDLITDTGDDIVEELRLNIEESRRGNQEVKLDEDRSENDVIGD